MIKQVLLSFAILLLNPIFSQTTPGEFMNLESIIGFEVADVTDDNLASLGMKPTTGARGVKLIHFGPKISKVKNFISMGEGVEGDILTHIVIQKKFGRIFENRKIWDLKDLCNTLIQYKEKGGNYTILAHALKTHNNKNRQYLIDINGLNASVLTQYVLNLGNPQKITEKTQNNIASKNTKRSSGDEEESKDIYASTVDFTNPGIFYAIIIGSSAYKDPGIPDLDSLPIKDAMALKNVLCKKYIFEKENVSALYNPTRRDIVIAFADMSKKITPNDNLLIFYAGHGHYEKESDIGYWLPTDAEVSNPSNWLYNDQLVADVKKIKSLHTLLISDACFSGSIFKTRAVNMEEANSFIKQKYALPSRKAITSGTLKTVPNKSVFIKYLLDRLTNNKEAFFTASQLFQSLEQPVSNNSKSLPQFGVIQNVGDEGGDFIFIKR